MLNQFWSQVWFVIVVLLGSLLLVITPQPAAPILAQSDQRDEPACLHCHSDLYYLHDTGKWFCISASPMQCAGCHGGDPTARTKEAAHLHRTAHPVINGDTTTCRQCHIEDCNERVAKFDAIAGISPVVLVSTPIGPAPALADVVTPLPRATKQTPLIWDWPTVAVLVTLVVGGAVLWWKRAHSN